MTRETEVAEDQGITTPIQMTVDDEIKIVALIEIHAGQHAVDMTTTTEELLRETIDEHLQETTDEHLQETTEEEPAFIHPR
jgi:hypothetical protein